MNPASWIASQAAYFGGLRSSLGLMGAARFRAAMLLSRFGLHPGVGIVMRHRRLAHPVRVRIASTDSLVFGQVVIADEYGPAFDALWHPKLMIDLGANVGFTSAMFLSRFPDAEVLAVEPFRENADAASGNLLAFGGRAVVMRVAAWGRRAILVVEHSPANQWGARVREAAAGEASDVCGAPMASLLRGRRVDLLKVDIEGSEADLFSASSDLAWLDSVGCLVIETHGPQCDAVVRAALAPYEFNESRSGELTIFAGLSRRLADG